MRHPICLSVLLVLAAPAFAADLPSTKAAFAPPDAPYAWSGFYAGVSGGYAWANTTTGSGALRATYGAAPAPQGGFGAIQGGYLAEYPNRWVLGVEGAVLPGSATNTVGVAGVSKLTTTSNFAASARVRLGYDAGQFMPYLAGGIAFASNTAKGFDPAHPGGFSVSTVHPGMTIGAGLEYAFAQHWTARVEYDFTAFGNKSYLGNPRAANANFLGAGVNYLYGH